MPGQATPCSSIEVVITSTTVNRVAVKSGPRVRISPAAPKKQTSLLGRLFFYPGEIRIENRQPPGAAGSSGPARTTPLYPPLRRICRRISPAAPEKERHPKRGASSFSAQGEIRIENRQPPGAAGSSGSARTTRRRRGRHIVRGDFLQKSPLTHSVAVGFLFIMLGVFLSTRPASAQSPLCSVFGCKKERHGLGPCRSWGSSGALFILRAPLWPAPPAGTPPRGASSCGRR